MFLKWKWILSENVDNDLFVCRYYTSRVFIGTPPQEFALIVDTGSTVTYVPCSSCTHCGPHQAWTISISITSYSFTYLLLLWHCHVAMIRMFECSNHLSLSLWSQCCYGKIIGIMFGILEDFDIFPVALWSEESFKLVPNFFPSVMDLQTGSSIQTW